ncbi:MAG TPA: hypothetical protein VF743_00935 [Acidimicrobiales bacterium]
MAADRRLGPLVASRPAGNRLATRLLGAVAAALVVGLVCLLVWLLVGGGAVFGVVALVAALVALAGGLLALAVGFTATYAYAGGLVLARNGRGEVTTWDQVAELVVRRSGGAVAGYELRTRAGRTLSVAATEGTRDVFGQVLQDLVRAAGGTVRQAEA